MTTVSIATARRLCSPHYQLQLESTTHFGHHRKSGNFQTEITGNFAPKSLVIYFRNAW